MKSTMTHKTREDFIKEFPDFGEALLNNYHGNVTDAENAATTHCGHYDTVEDYYEEYISELEYIPEWLTNYIKYDKIARDEIMDGTIFTVNDKDKGVHIFKQ